MRVLFVSGVDVGGAPRSTLELARGLTVRGHDLGVLLQAGAATGGVYRTCTSAAIKLREATGATWPRTLLRAFGGAASPGVVDEGVTVWRSPRPENALRPLLRAFRPDVVIANSFPREQMRWMLTDAHRVGVPFGLYMREEHSVTHLTMSRLPLDLVVGNSAHLSEAASAAGYPSYYVPSVVDLRQAAVESGRRELVLVNPVEENRPEILREVASRRPDIPCVMQESWHLPVGWRHELEAWARETPNLLLRRPQVRPADVYREARLVLATYGTGRPRVVLEAQYNGIPVIAADQAALREAAGAGGVYVALDSPIDEWARTITAVWDDEHYYRDLSESARQHARRPETDPETIVASFEQVVAEVTR